MDTKQAQQLAAEAERLVERLTAARCEASEAVNCNRAFRIGCIRLGALARLGRRQFVWSVAAYGPPVQPTADVDICDECGAEICDCIPPAAMAALLERIDADPHGHNDLTDLDIQY